MATLGERVRSLRQRQGLTQRQLGQRANLPHNSISRIESGQSPDITTKTLIALARALDVSADYLLGLSPRMERLNEPDHTK